MSEPVPGIHAEPDKDNLRYFHVTIDGPKDVSMHLSSLGSYAQFSQVAQSRSRVRESVFRLEVMLKVV